MAVVDGDILNKSLAIERMLESVSRRLDKPIRSATNVLARVREARAADATDKLRLSPKGDQER